MGNVSREFTWEISECTTVSTHLLLLFSTVRTGPLLHQLRQRLLWLLDVVNCLLLVSFLLGTGALGDRDSRLGVRVVAVKLCWANFIV